MSETNTTRQQFVNRIRDAIAERGGDHVQRPTLDPAVVRRIQPTDDLIETFSNAATEVGMFVHRCTGESLRMQLTARLNDLNIRTAVVGVGDDAQRQAVDSALAASGGGGEALDWRHDRTLDVQYDIHAGITDVQAAIAETGSIVVHSSAARGRGLSLVPPIHIAIVAASQILPDLADYMDAIAESEPGALPASQCIITGPSKTADIEGILVTGVHGPGAVHVLLMTDR